MYTKNDLRDMLLGLNIPSDATLMVHCRTEAVGDIEGGAQTLLDLLCELVCDGLLVLPTHTYATINAAHNLFDPSSEPSCTGILGDLLRQRKGAVRSLHPTHSVVAFGCDAEEFTADEHLRTTPCPREGCMGRLLDRYALELFIGCSLRESTFLHAVEEWNGIDNRLSEPFVCFVIMPDGSMFLAEMRSYESPVGDVSVNYDKLEAPLLELGAAKEGRIGDARCLLCGCDDIVRIASEFLICFPDLFADDSPVERRLIDDLRRLEEI